MLDIKRIRQNPQEVKAAVDRRGKVTNMDKVLEEMAADYLKLDNMLHHELREGIVAGPAEAMPKRRYPVHRDYER